MSSAFTSGQLALALVFLAGAFLTILYLFRLFNMIFLGEAKSPLAREGSRLMIVSVAILAALSLVAGLYIVYPSSFVHVAVKQMLGV
jgi:NADH:ubiquinone oxidoreductase subunit 5 (subunit L)/multisubunit Na+/H+ antiporter MnhA subunit